MKVFLIEEASAKIGVHANTLRRADRRGLLRAQRDYRGWRVYNLEDLLRFARDRKIKSLSPHGKPEAV